MSEYNRNYDKYGVQENAMVVTMNKVYSWMTLALVVTALTAMYVAQSESILGLVFGNSATPWILMLAEVGVVMYLSARINRISFATALTLFGVYSVLNGVVLSVILMVYELTTIYAAFFATAGTFAAMSFIGYTTKKDLSGLGGILTMALIGLIIASLVNIFLHNNMLNSIITYAGVFIFVGLTAYDTQKIKQMLVYSNGVDQRKIGLLGALSLYLDFINLFLYILRLLSSRRD